MAMKKGICKLCLQEKLLLKKSHIIPDFMYRDGSLYHPGHKLEMMDLGAAVKGKVEKTRRLSDGVYDQHILCEDCDRRVIGSLESYAKPVLYSEDIPGLKSKRKKKRDHLILTDVDYLKMKLFFYSIRWRASISKHRFFKGVDIRPAAMEKLRKMILDHEIKDHTAFPMIFMTCYDKVFSQSLVEPVTGKKRTSLFILPKISFITSRNIDVIPPQLRCFQIFQNGEMGLKVLSKAEFIDLWRTISN